MRATLIQISPDDHVVCVAMHHIVADGYSVNVMITELASLYEGVELPPLPVQAGDVSLWQLRREALDEARRRWPTGRRSCPGSRPWSFPSTARARSTAPASGRS